MRVRKERVERKQLLVHLSRIRLDLDHALALVLQVFDLVPLVGLGLGLAGVLALDERDLKLDLDRRLLEQCREQTLECAHERAAGHLGERRERRVGTAEESAILEHLGPLEQGRDIANERSSGRRDRLRARRRRELAHRVQQLRRKTAVARGERGRETLPKEGHEARVRLRHRPTRHRGERVREHGERGARRVREVGRRRGRGNARVQRAEQLGGRLEHLLLLHLLHQVDGGERRGGAHARTRVAHAAGDDWHERRVHLLGQLWELVAHEPEAIEGRPAQPCLGRRHRRAHEPDDGLKVGLDDEEAGLAHGGDGDERRVPSVPRRALRQVRLQHREQEPRQALSADALGKPVEALARVRGLLFAVLVVVGLEEAVVGLGLLPLGKVATEPQQHRHEHAEQTRRERVELGDHLRSPLC